LPGRSRAGGGLRRAGPFPGTAPTAWSLFRDAGFGLFIHWSVDGQLGDVISYSLVGAAPDYLERYFKELPRTFNPRKFHPEDWAALAKLAGIRYVVFTTKRIGGTILLNDDQRRRGCERRGPRP
jgi:alpha-L-fucosidase